MKYDVIIIGGGTAGLTLYKSLKKESKLVVIIDDKSFTTTCARVGCMPSKLLIAAAESCHAIEKSAAFGIDVTSYKVDSKRVLKRVQDERDRFLGYISEDLKDYPQEDFINSKAKFISNKELELSCGKVLSAEQIVIATGSKTIYPPVFKSGEDRIISSDHVFDLNNLPSSVAVIGAGIIGLEIGQALYRLGVKIKIFNRSESICSIADEKVRDIAKKAFLKELEIHFGSEVISCEKNANSTVKLEVQLKSELLKEDFDYIFVAAGRKPHLKDLGLENTDVSVDDLSPSFENGYKCLDSSGNETGIFMIGDASGDVPLLHTAAFDGKALSRILLGKSAYKKPVHLSILFSDPQVMQVGLSLKEIKEKKIDFEVSEVSFENQGRSRMFLINQGILRVYFEKPSGLILGAEMCGPDAEYFGHILALAIKNQETRSSLLELPFYHPTVFEALKTVLKN